eukprot:350242-Chlamydomonas_euryale.AAC.11
MPTGCTRRVYVCVGWRWGTGRRRRRPSALGPLLPLQGSPVAGSAARRSSYRTGCTVMECRNEGAARGGGESRSKRARWRRCTELPVVRLRLDPIGCE